MSRCFIANGICLYLQLAKPFHGGGEGVGGGEAMVFKKIGCSDYDL